MPVQNHYELLGLDRDCSDDDIRVAYRALAKLHHPDVTGVTPEALARIQALNDAYHILGDPSRRRIYDGELDEVAKRSAQKASKAATATISQDVHLSIQDFFRGIALQVNVRDPANPHGAETYELVVPPDTAPGTRFRLKRVAPFSAGWLVVRVKARPDMRFKVRGSDLRCDVRIQPRRAESGGLESIRGASGQVLQLHIPPRVPRGEVLRIAGEGLPKARGGRGDLLVRVMYRPEVRVTRGAAPSPSAPPARGRLMLRGQTTKP